MHIQPPEHRQRRPDRRIDHALPPAGAGLADRIIGCDRSEQVLDRAPGLGMLDECTVDPCHAVRDASLVVFCTPVDRVIDSVTDCCGACRPGTLLTDVGSTKSAIVRRLAGRMPPGVNFVGSHPVAGSEKATGWPRRRD